MATSALPSVSSCGLPELTAYQFATCSWTTSDLVPGKEWPKQIHEFMAKCHAAVILLTENAVRSDWVLKEARSHTDRARFKSVPAPVADLPHPPDPPQPARNVLRVISAFVTDVSDQMTQMIKFTC